MYKIKLDDGLLRYALTKSGMWVIVAKWIALKHGCTVYKLGVRGWRVVTVYHEVVKVYREGE